MSRYPCDDGRKCLVQCPPCAERDEERLRFARVGSRPVNPDPTAAVSEAKIDLVAKVMFEADWPGHEATWSAVEPYRSKARAAFAAVAAAAARPDDVQALKDRAEKAEAKILRPMSEAPRGRTPVLLKLKNKIPGGMECAHSLSGLWLVALHEGVTVSGYDLGWSFAAPVGYGGISEEWCDGWLPLPGSTTPEDRPLGAPARDEGGDRGE